jgi:hypothetical protein
MDEFVRVPPGEVDDPDEKAEDDRYFNEYVTTKFQWVIFQL